MSCRKLRDGSLLVEYKQAKQLSRLQELSLFNNIPVSVPPHRTLNSSKSVVSCYDLKDMPEKEICENLAGQGVCAVRRIFRREGNSKVPTATLILTFNRPLLPDTIKVGYLKLKVRLFVPNPLQCF